MGLFGAAGIATVASVALQSLVLVVALVWLGKGPIAAAERAAMAVLPVDLLIAVACVVWFARQSAADIGSPRYGWVLVFGLWQTLLLALAAFITLLAMNR
jgi:hypothetical protein